MAERTILIAGWQAFMRSRVCRGRPARPVGSYSVPSGRDVDLRCVWGRDTRRVGGSGVASTDTAAVSAGGPGPTPPDRGEGPAAAPGTPPLLAGVPGVLIDARELFLNRRLQVALDSGDTEQLVQVLELLPLG